MAPRPQLMVNHWMINIMHGREYITVVLTGKTGTGMHPVSKIGHMEIQWENSRNMIFPWEKTGVMIVFLEHGVSWVSEMTTIATLHRHGHHVHGYRIVHLSVHLQSSTYTFTAVANVNKKK